MYEKDYYSILGVNKTDSQLKIKKAYRKKAFKYHPDINKDEGATEKFQLLTEAYAVLSDETRRKDYDNKRYESLEKYSRSDLIKSVDLDKIFQGIDLVLKMQNKTKSSHGHHHRRRRRKHAIRRKDSSLPVDLLVDVAKIFIGGSSSGFGGRHMFRMMGRK